MRVDARACVMSTFMKHCMVDIVILLQKYDFAYCNVSHLTGGRVLFQRCQMDTFQEREC